MTAQRYVDLDEAAPCHVEPVELPQWPKECLTMAPTIRSYFRRAWCERTGRTDYDTAPLQCTLEEVQRSGVLLQGDALYWSTPSPHRCLQLLQTHPLETKARDLIQQGRRVDDVEDKGDGIVCGVAAWGQRVLGLTAPELQNACALLNHVKPEDWHGLALYRLMMAALAHVRADPWLWAFGDVDLHIDAVRRAAESCSTEPASSSMLVVHEHDDHGTREGLARWARCPEAVHRVTQLVHQGTDAWLPHVLKRSVQEGGRDVALTEVGPILRACLYLDYGMHALVDSHLPTVSVMMRVLHQVLPEPRSDARLLEALPEAGSRTLVSWVAQHALGVRECLCKDWSAMRTSPSPRDVTGAVLTLDRATATLEGLQHMGWSALLWTFTALITSPCRLAVFVEGGPEAVALLEATVPLVVPGAALHEVVGWTSVVEPSCVHHVMVWDRGGAHPPPSFEHLTRAVLVHVHRWMCTQPGAPRATLVALTRYLHPHTLVPATTS